MSEKENTMTSFFSPADRAEKKRKVIPMPLRPTLQDTKEELKQDGIMLFFLCFFLTFLRNKQL